jgi:hypothetical protein
MEPEQICAESHLEAMSLFLSSQLGARAGQVWQALLLHAAQYPLVVQRLCGCQSPLRIYIQQPYDQVLCPGHTSTADEVSRLLIHTLALKFPPSSLAMLLSSYHRCSS